MSTLPDTLTATVTAYARGTSPPLAGRRLGAWLTAHAEAGRPTAVSPNQVGVYLATPDTGVQAALDFWREALEVGVGFANPRIFPWTLANSAAAHLALQLDCRGPNYTLVGDAEAAFAVAQHALVDLQQQRVDAALLGAVATTGTLRLALLWLAPAGATPHLSWVPTFSAGAATPTTALAVYDRLAAADPCHLTTRYEGTLSLT